MPAAGPVLAAGPLANQSAVQQSPVASGVQSPDQQSFASAMRAQVQQTQRPDDAQAGNAEVTAPELQRGIIAARASPDIPMLSAPGIAPELMELSTGANDLPGKSLPLVGNNLPNPELPATGDELPISAPVSGDSPAGEIRVPAAAPAPADALADSRLNVVTTEARPASPVRNSVVGATFSESSSLASQPEPGASMTGNTGGQSANTGSDTPSQSYRAIESTLVAQMTREDTSIAQMPKFVMPSDSVVAPASNTLSPASGPGGLTDLMDLPQMPSMRTLQPTADPELFSNGLSNRLMMMSQDGVQSARLKLYPEHLGPLDVRIQIDDDGARVWFGAQHGQTREALEAAIPRLRELFADQGLQLVRADVSSGQNREQTTDGSVNRADLTTAGSSEESTELAESFTPSIARVTDRLLDVYV